MINKRILLLDFIALLIAVSALNIASTTYNFQILSAFEMLRFVNR